MPPKRHLPAEVAAAFCAVGRTGGRVAGTKNAGEAAEQGRRAPRHWAFQPIKPIQPPPEIRPASLAGRSIGSSQPNGAPPGCDPVRPADRRTLIRRVTFDLIGLPPTPEEVADFEHDASPAAFARVVDRLLASPHYGERWGRHWMDVVRYADTAGDNADYPIPEAARYRDYIIDSFNRDKPFDQFVREQLAGDILARRGETNSYAESVVATGFLALSRRYATAPFELWHLTLEDTIETTGRAFLGLTLRCARCHDHKFDPVSQRDYYALYGIFASTTFPYAGSEELHSKAFPRLNFVPLVEPGARRAQAEGLSNERQKSSTETIKSLESEERRLDRVRRLSRAADGADSSQAAVASARSRRAATPSPRGSRSTRRCSGGAIPPVRATVVPRGVPRFAIPGRRASQPAVSAQGSGRLELARWLTQPDNPLTPRVMVNRIWQHHFGRGIVATPSNFGLRGDPPTHPELLDWLAARFVAAGWSIKTIHREILLSQTYQLSSDLDPHDAALDPDDRWLWRFPRQRLDAESIRDAMLAVAGNLDENRPGLHPFPPIETWHWTQHDAFKAVYPSNHAAVYLMTQRLVKHPYLAIFDGPDTNVSTEGPPTLDGPAPGPLPHEQSVRPGTGGRALPAA